MNLPVYVDYHSTTPLDPEVMKAMMPYFTEKFGNPSAKGHTFGWEADSAVNNARDIIADYVHASPTEIYFTGSTTEAVNLIHFGIAESYSAKGNHIITSSIEHSAVLGSLNLLEKKGFRITYIPVTKEGLLNLELLQKSFSADTILVSVMTANNEIGVINDIAAVGRMCRDRKVFFHTDAAQAIGKTDFNVSEMNIDAASFSAHKIYGPKGVGALYLRKGITVTPQVYGGGQEKGLRAGTLNVPGIVGFGKAVEIYSREMQAEKEKITLLRDKLYKDLIVNLDGVHINGSMERRLYNNINIRFDNVRSEDLLLELRDVALSTGSACASESFKPSHVLKAIGLTDEQARSSVRIGLGRFNTPDEMEYVSNRIIESIIKLRSISTTTKMRVE